MKECFFQERSLYYRISEKVREGPVLVFIQGLSGSSSAWLKYEEAFEKKYRVLSMDIRGHGKSNKPDGYSAYEIEKIADDIKALIEHLGIQSFIPISHSFGTLIAVSLLREHPERAVAAIFISPIFGMFNTFLTRASRILIHTAAYSARAFSFSSAPGGHTDYSRLGYMGDWSLRRISRDVPNTTLHVFLYCLDHAYAHDFDPWWSDIRIPTLIIQGTRDSIAPAENAKKLSRELLDSTLVLMKGANHILPLNNFEETRKAIETYLDKHLPRMSVSDS